MHPVFTLALRLSRVYGTVRPGAIVQRDTIELRRQKRAKLSGVPPMLVTLSACSRASEGRISMRLPGGCGSTMNVTVSLRADRTRTTAALDVGATSR